MAPKTYFAHISFDGNNLYLGLYKVVKIVIKKARAILTAKKKTFKFKVKTKKYTIKLKDSFGKAIKNAKITLKIKKKTYNAKTNPKEKQHLNLNLRKRENSKQS